jgi:hypothetical protein
MSIRMDSRTFSRRGATLTVTRERTADGVALVAIESGRRRTFIFSHLAQLDRFQCDMESFLQRTGWSPADASAPETTTTEPPAAAAVPARAGSRLRLALEEEEEVATRE